MPQSNGFCQILIESQRSCNGTGNLGNLQRMSQTGAVMISFGRDEHLCLMLHAPKGFAVDDTISVPLKIRTEIAFFLGAHPPFGCGTFCRQRTQYFLLQFFLKQTVFHSHPSFFFLNKKIRFFYKKILFFSVKK